MPRTSVSQKDMGALTQCSERLECSTRHRAELCAASGECTSTEACPERAERSSVSRPARLSGFYDAGGAEAAVSSPRFRDSLAMSEQGTAVGPEAPSRAPSRPRLAVSLRSEKALLAFSLRTKPMYTIPRPGFRRGAADAHTWPSAHSSPLLFSYTTTPLGFRV
jgi:hypothetical protein